MLHAITQKKTSIHLRYLGHREDGERRITAEDEITALLLGPLAFMPYADIATFWKAIIGQPMCWSWWPQGDVEMATMSFWERRKTPTTRPIEADLLVDLRWPDGVRRTLLVELKWRSKLSGEDQLHEQWKWYLRDDERPALHLFIAPQVSEALQAQARNDIWGDYLLPLSWQQVLSKLSHQNDGSPGLKRLITQMVDTLKLLQIRPFMGFSTLASPAQHPVTGPIFWREKSPIQE